MASEVERQSKSAPFLVRTPRFQSLGLHPELLSSSEIKTSANIAPGTYDLMQYGDFSEKNIQKKMEGPNWEQALNTEKMAKIPHLSFKETYERRKEDDRRVGPGSYRIDDFLTEADRRPHCVRGALDQLSQRFPEEKLVGRVHDKAPPPGAYGIPDEKITQKHWQQGSNVPSFEWNQGPRTLPLQGSKVGPGTYNIKSSVDELINKRVSEKGPYQVFSGSRSAPIKTGHYAVLDTWDLSPDFPSKNYPESISMTGLMSKSIHGRFSKLDRFQKKPTNRLAIEHPGLEPKNVDFPGPGAYAIGRAWEQSNFHRKKVPFNSSSSRNDRRAFTHIGGHQTIGVGRYNLVTPVRDETVADKRRKSKKRVPFCSSTNRFGSASSQSLLNERLKPQNLRIEQRTQLHMTGRLSA